MTEADETLREEAFLKLCLFLISPWGAAKAARWEWLVSDQISKEYKLESFLDLLYKLSERCPAEVQLKTARKILEALK